jgi:deoxycytidine triphosphate deaminase
MSILVDWQIEKLCNDGFVKPYDKSLINPTSLDITLGKIVLVDILGGFKEYNIENYTKDNPFLIKPNGFLLACTDEYFTIPVDKSVEFKLKSSRARERLSHSLAGWAECGFHGSLTLELKNYSAINPVAIYYKQKIGQAIIHDHALPDIVYGGKYSGADRPMLSKDY